MTLKERSTTRLALSRLASVVICLCVFASTSLPQRAMLTWAKSAEEKCPSQEEEESFEEELAVCSSARRNSGRRNSAFHQLHETGARLHGVASYTRRPQAIIGHLLSNGFSAPLLI